MLNAKNLGYTIRFTLPNECGYPHTYTVECRYKYDKEAEKYLLSMWLCRSDIPDRFKIDGQEIDTQYISSTRETIWNDIGRLVEYAALSGFFDRYVKEYEYTYKCCDRGNEFFEMEQKNAEA